jgi:hypothetical protein
MLGMAVAKINLLFALTQADCPGYNNSFFGFPHWWKYLNVEKDPLGKCAPVFVFPHDIWAVALAIIDILLRLAGIAAVISIIIAGIGYITAAGSADKITASRKRIVNSLLGLGVVLVAATIVSFIGNSIG